MEYGECPFILLQIFGAFIQQRAELAANSGSGSGGSTIDLADVGAGLGEQVIAVYLIGVAHRVTPPG